MNGEPLAPGTPAIRNGVALLALDPVHECSRCHRMAAFGSLVYLYSVHANQFYCFGCLPFPASVP